jgi:hypothetical protein
MKDEPLAGTLNVSADKIDLNKWMGTTPTTDTATTATSEPFVVPANISFVLNAKADQVKYDKVDYNNIAGTVIIKDQTVTLKNISTQALDGTIAIDGSYSTKANKKNPAISLTYDVNNLDIQKTFYAFNTVQKIMPVGKFISGKMQSKLTMNGTLGQDMMPNLGTLTGNGNLLLLQGVLSKFTPVDKLASSLNINALQNVSLKDVKAYFDFAGGKVLVKPFKFNVSNIDMEVGGTHGLDQTIDYAINMKVPRSMMGSAANNLVNSLSAEAAKKGVPVNVGDVIPLTVHMGGTMTNPTIKTDMSAGSNSLADEMKQQATNFAKAAADSAKVAIKDSANAIKNQVINDAKKEITDKLFGNKDTTAANKNVVDDNKKRIEDAGKSVINNLFKKKGS